MQKKYRVVIEETVADEFDVDAESEEDAVETAIKKYRNCDIVLHPGECQHRQVRLVCPTVGEWQEF